MPFLASSRAPAGACLFVASLLFALASPSPKALAQDADGDGVPDSRDVCPSTEMGLSVDGAGCDAFCEVVDQGTDVFLRSRLLEVGTATAASFGAASPPPAGWHPRGGGGLLGFVADPDRTDWTDFKGDFFVPGSPEEGFGLSVGGLDFFNSTLQGVQGIPGGFTGTRVECRPLVCGLRGGGAAFWSGSVAGIDVDKTISVLNEGLFILVEVTLTNNGLLPTTVTYMRNVDPDNMQPVTGSYDTTNSIVSQGDGTASSLALVTATTSGPDSYLALISSDPDARVAYGGFSNRDPDAIWNCTGYSCTPGDSLTDDIAISLAIRKSLAAGESVTFSYAYTLDAVEVATATECTIPAVCGDGIVEGTESCDDGGTMPGDGCSATCTVETGWDCMGAPSMCAPICGDGVVIAPETCDDDGTASGDGCSATCSTEPGYACVGAPSTCAPVCGDGVVIAPETCDDDGNLPGDGCSATCTTEPGYVCMGAPSTCAPECGDGIVIAPETCDDDGTSSGDGCSATCSTEPGYACAGAPSTCAPVCGDGVVIAPETCDDDGNLPGDGCSATCTTEPGYECMGAPSTCAPVCGDGVVLPPETCDDDNTDSGDGCSSGCSIEPGFVCAGTPSVCAPCFDTMAGSGTDDGCTSAAPHCTGSGPTAFCAVCEDDTSGGTDSGCTTGSPVCDTSAAVPVCTACEDSAGGSGVDNGCDAATPVCGTSVGGIATCVECAEDSHCGVGTVCDGAGSCVAGCTDDADCAPTPATPVCNVAARSCAECLTNADCLGTEVCGLALTCESVDTDGDLVPDEADDDDDNDGIPDIEEIDSTLLGDSNDNGILDYEDSAIVTCEDSSPADGVCDSLPMSTDFDGDGIANHLDLDADGDGIADLAEGGGADVDGDGRVDGFADIDGDGLHDPLLPTPLTLPISDGDSSPDFLDRDADDDGLTDTFEAGGTDADGNGVSDDTTDGNGDGIADGLTGLGVLPAPDTDGDTTADYRDVDSDGDGIGDGVEGTDADGDGEADIELAGADTDGDGLDDAFDPDCADAADCGGVLGMVATPPNSDGEGPANWRDIDSDGDGLTDDLECPLPAMCPDSDEDGTPDYLSLDADGDGIVDATEGHDDDSDGVADTEPVGVDTDGDGLDDAFDADCADAADCGGVIGVTPTPADLDMDGAANFQDPDDDGDGMDTSLEQMDADEYEGPATDPTDVDEDGQPNWYDDDSDGDTASDRTESGGDRDENDDGILDYLDPTFRPVDTDGDGVIDSVECPAPASPVTMDCPDSDGDGAPDYDDTDDDGDGIPTADEEAAGPDTDGDGTPNRLDDDSDDDGISDADEGNDDTDSDGRGNAFDVDSDGDGLRDANEGTGDTDSDGTPDYLDTDSDGDGAPDAVEGHDANGDGVADTSPAGVDMNGDGLDDGYDAALGGTDAPTQDTDGDGTPDVVDGDDDGDGVDTRFEGPTAQDTDGDGTPDYLDADDDGDGTPTADENADPNGDGDPNDAQDTDGDGTPDYLDDTDDTITTPTGGGAAGGALCSASPGRGEFPLAMLLGLVALVLRRRRRATPGRTKGGKASRWLPFLLVALAALSIPRGAHAQVGTLDRFRASETTNDDFHLSRPSLLGHLKLSAQLHLDYGLRPLIWETVAGDSGSDERSIVDHQLNGTLGVGFGLYDRVVIFAGLPIGLVMNGASDDEAAMLGLPGADGAGLGDVYLGGRVGIWGDDEDKAAIAGQLTLTFPTSGDSSYRGDSFLTVHPELLAEVRPADDFRIVINVGALIRESNETMTNLQFGHELTYGLGAGYTVWRASDAPRTHLDVVGQVYGSTAFELFGDRDGTALEATVGGKFFHESGVVAGIAAGPGLSRGFGSPDMRLVATVGWAMPEDEVAEPVDTDGDGIMDPDDRCVGEPEDVDTFEDTDGCPDVDNDGDGILDAADSCPLEPETVNDFEDADGCPDEVGDADGDGIVDTSDACPSDPEDADGHEDEDGCPDPDNDGDGVLDGADRCVNEPGPVPNHGCPDADRDGDTVVDRLDNCPDEPGSVENHGCVEQQQVVIQDGQLEVLDIVYFRTSSARIRSRSYPLLMNVARVINAHPEIRSVDVIGHTDARGNPDRNLTLSRARAASVVEFLVERGGVDASRLQSHGYGQERPVIPNARTLDEHAQNRRVEFKLDDGDE
ncbi:MAG: DUF4215 domain-containing protein [Deltaproteobacteria bacterium]|nr:DUF4215 domain-containing protein [Deltaproteobacteria bacterium]